MQKIIGLDIGSYSIKAVEIVNSFKSYEIVNFYENVIPNLEDFSSEVILPVCMEQLFKENNLTADRIITAMPGQYISSRVMPFAFSDPKKIKESIYGEVEDRVPFELDDMIIDHQILGNAENQTLVLVVMTRKNFLRTFLEHLERIEINPKLVDVDSLALYNLAPYLKTEPGQVAAIVDVGHEKTSVCIVQDGILRMFRSIKHGGKAITEFLSRDLEVDYNEAQRVKHRVSRIVWKDDDPTDMEAEDIRIARRIGLSANAIVKELGRTFYAFKTWEKTPISKLFLSGGTAKISDFDKYLSENLAIEVEKSNLFQTGLLLDPELKKYSEVIPQAVSIGLRAVSGVKRQSLINLRKGEFAYNQDYESILKVSSSVMRYLGVGMLIITLSYISQYVFYKNQISSLQEEFKREYFKQVPETKRKYAGSKVVFAKLQKDAFSRLQTDISQKRQAVVEFQQSSGGPGALNALKELSDAVPKELKIEITSYEYNMNADHTGRLIIKGETNDSEGFGAVSRLIDLMKKNASFSDVKEKSSGAKPGTDNKVIEFSIQFSYTPSGGKA